MLSKCQFNILMSSLYYEGPKFYEDYRKPEEWESRRVFNEDELKQLDWLIEEGYVYIITHKDISFIYERHEDPLTYIQNHMPLIEGNLDYTSLGFKALSEGLAQRGNFGNYTNMSSRAKFPIEPLYVRSAYVVWPCLLSLSGYAHIQSNVNGGGKQGKSIQYQESALSIEDGIKMNIAHYESDVLGCRVSYASDRRIV